MNELEKIISEDEETIIKDIENTLEEKSNVLIYYKSNKDDLWNVKGFDKYKKLSIKNDFVKIKFEEHEFDFNYKTSKFKIFNDSILIEKYYNYKTIEEKRLYLLE